MLNRRRFTAAIALATAAAVTMTLTPAQATPAATPAPPPEPTPQAAPALAEVLRPVAQDAHDALAYSFAVVAADPAATFREGTVEADLQRGFATLAPERRQNFANYGAALLKATTEERVAQFGRHGRLTPEQFRALGFDGVFTADTVPGDRAGVREYITAEAARLEADYVRDEAQAVRTARELGIEGTVLQLPRLKTLTFYLERVDCVDETNPEWLGDDEISIGGLKIDHAATTTKIDPFEVAGNFDDGESKDYGNPGHPFAQFDLTASGYWARTFVVTAFLAEVDNGGFAGALNSAWDKVKNKVQEVVASWVGNVASAWFGEAIGQAIGQVVGWLVGAFVGWVINLFKDDLFAPVTATVTLPSRFSFMYDNPLWYGWSGKRLPMFQLNWHGHGGHYRANVHWQVA